MNRQESSKATGIRSKKEVSSKSEFSLKPIQTIQISNMTLSGRGRGRGGLGRDRGNTHDGRGAGGSTTVKLQGLCPDLGENVFTYREKGSADQIKTTQDKIVQYVGIQYGNEISREVLNQTEFIIPNPDHSQETLDEHDNHVKKI